VAEIVSENVGNPDMAPVDEALVPRADGRKTLASAAGLRHLHEKGARYRMDLDED